MTSSIQHMFINSRRDRTSLKGNNNNLSSPHDPKDFVNCTKYSAAELVFMFITLHRNKRLSQMIFKDPLQEIRPTL